MYIVTAREINEPIPQKYTFDFLTPKFWPGTEKKPKNLKKMRIQLLLLSIV
jgi:hypothetical protein